jgi:hypothetical protein
LDAVLEAVELRWQVSIIAHWRSGTRYCPFFCDVHGGRACRCL